jgi:hypothetical protein
MNYSTSGKQKEDVVVIIHTPDYMDNLRKVSIKIKSR